MRDSLILYLNGAPLRVSGTAVFSTLSTFLRGAKHLTGTKVVCEEGDCGACTVLIGSPRAVKDDAPASTLEYVPVNSCIQFLYQLDCRHIVTIEGMKTGKALNEVQESMLRHHGAQCGYCTPGFVVALGGLFEARRSASIPAGCKTPTGGHLPATRQEVKDALTGNLCRCTGYDPIIEAALAVDPGRVVALNEQYPPAKMLEDFRRHAAEPLLIEVGGRKFASPADLEGAARFKGENPGTVIVQGSTDVGVQENKRGFQPPSILSLGKIPGLGGIEFQNGSLVVGAAVTLSRLEEATKEALPELYEILRLFGSPQIRNAATLAGNIANGSPIADTLPCLYVLGAEVELTGTAGRRRVAIESFYRGYKTFDMEPGELICRVFIPLPAPQEILKLYKVSKRKDLDISAFTAAIRMTVEGGTIRAPRLAYGGVGPVVLRLPRSEEFLTGKPLSLATMRGAGEIARGEIAPISDVRGSKEFRLRLAENILEKFFYDVEGSMELACQ